TTASFNPRKEHPPMATNPSNWPAPQLPSEGIGWLLDSDPAIRCQVLQDFIGAPDEVAAERALGGTEGVGAAWVATAGAGGRWRCEGAHGATRSSFNTTICVLEALLAHEQVDGGRPEVTAAGLCGQEYLLERRLFRRASTGAVIAHDRKGGAAWTRFAFPTW